jgi:transposase
VLSLPATVRVFFCREPVDFRKAHDGLVAIVRSHFAADPLDGSLFVFLNRRRDRIKLLQWDGNGLWMHYKRLEAGTFRALDQGPSITRAELSMLLEGIEVKMGKLERRFADSLGVEARQSDDVPQQDPRRRCHSAARAARRA